MIVELFGLPGSGKTTFAQSFAAEGAILIPASDRLRMLGESFLFFLSHPIRAVRLFLFIRAHAPREHRGLLLANLFFSASAKYLRARRASREGKVALVDQGYFQAFLSLFGSTPDDAVLRELVRILPEPDMLLVLDVSPAQRAQRMAERGRRPREEFGAAAVAAFAAAAENTFPRAVSLFKAYAIPHEIISGSAPAQLSDILKKNVSYVTIARMPTEKAHGVSIAHMCASFASAGAKVSLIVPKRENLVTADLSSYYGVLENFAVQKIAAPDFVGHGLTSPFFFFIQRLLFLFALRRVSIPPGIVYTREPEIAWFFSSSHRAIFEAHRWPSGFSGWLQARLLGHAALVVCNSHGTEAAAKRHGIARTAVAPNGFDAALFASAKHKTRAELGLPERTLAIYIGSSQKGKGAEVVERARAALHGASVFMLGNDIRVSPAHVPEYLLSADMLLLPNTNEGESERFTSPVKLFEYLGAGKVIIASDLPPMREILKDDDAFFVRPGDAEALAKAIEMLARDHALRARLAARAKALSAFYTWDARAKRILKALPL
ncbi:glycosyltransferase [Candidatus Kaiserbacteria bacterium]|nr:glycosyltransferase [Candidatus Kaiserbacteria bacterium]